MNETLEQKLAKLGYTEETNYDSSNVNFTLHTNKHGQQVIVMQRGDKEFLMTSVLTEPDGVLDAAIEPEIIQDDLAMLLS